MLSRQRCSTTTFLNGNDRLKRLARGGCRGHCGIICDLILDQAPVLQTPVVNADESVTLAMEYGAVVIIVFTAELTGSENYVCLEETEETGYSDIRGNAGNLLCVYGMPEPHVGYGKIPTQKLRRQCR